MTDPCIFRVNVSRSNIVHIRAVIQNRVSDSNISRSDFKFEKNIHLKLIKTCRQSLCKVYTFMQNIYIHCKNIENIRFSVHVSIKVQTIILYLVPSFRFSGKLRTLSRCKPS